MNITILAKKGGVGKSTVSLLLYEAFRHAGKTVSIHDWNVQGTSTKALELINGGKLGLDRQATIIIWDTPPSLDHNATATAVRNANNVLIAPSPAPADIWDAENSIKFEKALNAKPPVLVVFNK